MRRDTTHYLTPEQLDIVYLNEKKDVYIQAYAGSGKTTVLREFALERPFSPILYLVFNRHNRKEAQLSFPANVTVHTMNSYVYKKLGLKTIFDFLPPSFMEKEFSFSDYALALEMSFAFEEYISFGATNFPYTDKLEYIYEKMRRKEIPFTQGAAVRYFLESFREDLSLYEYVLVDEAQDVDPLFKKLIDRFHAKKIFVGDVYQSIYGFRNTINLFEKIPENAVKKSLTKSFRFGDGYAKKLNDLCQKMYGEPFFIRGNENIETVIKKPEDIRDRPVHIARTNAKIFERAYGYAAEGEKIAIPLDFEHMRDIVFDVFYIKSGLLYRVQKLKGINSFEKCVAAGRYDREIGVAISVVDTFGVEIFDMFDVMRNSLTNKKFADRIFYTAHKAKGLEFENVIVENDFNPRKDREEKNLFYMAATRTIETIGFTERKNF